MENIPVSPLKTGEASDIQLLFGCQQITDTSAERLKTRLRQGKVWREFRIIQALTPKVLNGLMLTVPPRQSEAISAQPVQSGDPCMHQKRAADQARVYPDRGRQPARPVCFRHAQRLPDVRRQPSGAQEVSAAQDPETDHPVRTAGKRCGVLGTVAAGGV